MERRLTAILAADVVGYSRLMASDEAGTLAALKSHRQELVDGAIAEHHGRIFKLTGDGILAEFPSVVNAVACAAEIQRRMRERNAEAPENKRIEFRIGVNLGDVVTEDDDIFGDGVNVAARIESIASPGGVAVSATVRDHVGNKLDVGFQDMGEHVLKNIEQAVRVYNVVLLDRPFSHAAAKREGWGKEKASIAVLPFENMSGEREQEYFADGMVEEIITALSRFGNLLVIARNSSFTYKGRAVDVKQVGRELGVRYILEGSVRKAGDRIRITVQLIDALSGAHLWADRFEGALPEIFDLQDQAATSVVGAIAPRLEVAEIERAKRKPTEDLDAYDYYLRALAIANRMTREANDETLRLFNEAIRRDDGFALAHARAAYCYQHRKANSWMVDRELEVAEAARLARRAVELGRNDAVALCYGGHVLGYVAGELDDGAAFVNRALVLNSNLAAAWAASGWMKICFGEPDIAVEHVTRAIRLSPVDPQLFTWAFMIALAHYCAGRYEEAASWAESAVRYQPNFASALRIVAGSRALGGHAAGAGKAMARLRELYPALRASGLDDVMPPFRRPEDRARYVDGLRKAGLPD